MKWNNFVSFTFHGLLIGCLLFYGCNQAPKAEPNTSSQQTPKVLLIGVDGTRIDVLKEVPTPNIDKLIQNGFLSDKAETRMPTVSGPGWSSMLTGVWSDKHGVKGNQFKDKNYEKYPDFLTRLEQADYEFSTFSATTWPPLGSSMNGGPLISDTVDVKMTFNTGSIGGYPAADSQAVTAAAAYLEQENPDAAFVYIGNPDAVAHQLGPLTEEYREALRQVDQYVGQLVDAIKGRPSYDKENWLILMSTDHGHVDKGGHGGPSEVEKNIFFLGSGPSANKVESQHPVYIVDVAVTALNHLGIPVKKDWGLDGRSVGLKN